VLLAGADGFLELNELRQPELFRSLQARPSLGPYRGSRASLLERCAREAGLALELPSTVPPDPNHAYDPREGINRWWSPGSLLDDLGGGARGMELILEKDRVRVVHEEEARIFWERWWAEKRR
jgi:hypothetical protein